MPLQPHGGAQTIMLNIPATNIRYVPNNWNRIRRSRRIVIVVTTIAIVLVIIVAIIFSSWLWYVFVDSHLLLYAHNVTLAELFWMTQVFVCRLQDQPITNCSNKKSISLSEHNLLQARSTIGIISCESLLSSFICRHRFARIPLNTTNNKQLQHNLHFRLVHR